MGTIRLGKRTEGPLTENQRDRSARRPRQHRLRRLGYFRRELVSGGAHGRRARAVAARSDQARARSDQADDRRVRSALREAARRPEREEGQEQEGSRRAASRRHPRVQERQRPRSPGDGVVRQHRSVHEGIGGAPVDRGVREGARGERSDDSVEHGLHVRRADGRRAVRERRAQSLGRRAGDDGARAAEEAADRAARTSRPGRRG